MKQFEECMEYIFEHKKSIPIGSFKNEEKITPWGLFCCGMMFTTRRDIIQYNPITVEVGVHAAIIFLEELWYNSKAAAKYYSAIGLTKIMNKLSSEKQRSGLAISSRNSVSESLH